MRVTRVTGGLVLVWLLIVQDKVTTARYHVSTARLNFTTARLSVTTASVYVSTAVSVLPLQALYVSTAS